jgi:acyl-coenzyme A thioesterase PaaI-like protein
MYHLLRKVTERHIQLGGQNTMKFSVAAQVMNSTVAAAISSLVTVGKYNSTVSLNDT